VTEDAKPKRMRSAEKMRAAEERSAAKGVPSVVAAPAPSTGRESASPELASPELAGPELAGPELAGSAPARSPMIFAESAPRPWWRRAELYCAAVGLAAHIGLLAYARKAPSPVYTFVREDATDVVIDTETPETPKDQIVEKDEPKDETPSNDSSEEAGSNTAARHSASHVQIGANHGDGAVIASENGDANSAGSAPDSTHRHHEGPINDDYDTDDVQTDEFDPLAQNGSHRRLGVEPDVGENGRPAPTTTQKTARIDRNKANDVLNKDLHEKDAKLGMILPAAGTVGSTVKAAAYELLPDKAQGTIVVTLGADGKVTSVKVASMAGGTSGDWEAVAANVKAALSAKTLNLNDEYKKGAIVAINVVSLMQNPSGTDPDSPVKFGTTTTFDISDLGAEPIHQVRTQISVTPVK